jgi:hypothetical protein
MLGQILPFPQKNYCRCILQSADNQPFFVLKKSVFSQDAALSESENFTQ